MSIRKFKFLDDLIKWDSNFNTFLEEFDSVDRVASYMDMLTNDANILVKILDEDDISDAERVRYLEIRLKLLKMITLMMNIVSRDENESLDLGRMILNFSTNNRSYEFNFNFSEDNYIAIFTGNSISLYNFYYSSGEIDAKISQRIYPITSIEYYTRAITEL